MPRKASYKAHGPAARSDGEVTAGNITDPTQGHPNGRPPSLLPQAAAAGAGGREGYGDAGALRAAVAATPPLPGGTPAGAAGHDAMAAYAAHLRATGRHPTPLFAPTERPWEPVTAGAPLASGPTNPMAAAGMAQPPGGASPAVVFQQAAAVSNSPTLARLAAIAAATSGSSPAP